jgi:hypothetical protein
MDAAGPFQTKRWLEEHLGTPDAHGADSDDVTLWQIIRFRLIWALRRYHHLGIDVTCKAAEFPLDIPLDLAFCGGGEGIAALRLKVYILYPARSLPAISNRRMACGKRTPSPLTTRCLSCDQTPKARARLNRHIHRWRLESLKHDLVMRSRLTLGLNARARLESPQHRGHIESHVPLSIELGALQWRREAHEDASPAQTPPPDFAEVAGKAM